MGVLVCAAVFCVLVFSVFWCFCVSNTYLKRYMCLESKLEFWGVPKYLSSNLAKVASATSNKRKLESQCEVALPKRRSGLPRAEAKTVACPVGNAEAGPAMPEGYKLLTPAQAKRVAKASEFITSDSLALGELIDELEKEAYASFLPPFLLPKARLQQAALEEVSATLEGIHSVEWVGIFAGSWKEVQPARLAAAGLQDKLKEIVDEHRPLDSNGVPLEAKGKAK